MKRRNFIKTGVAGAALLGMPRFATELSAMPAAGRTLHEVRAQGRCLSMWEWLDTRL